MLPIQYLVYPFIILLFSLQYTQTPRSTQDPDNSQLVAWSKKASQLYLQGKYSEALALNDKILASLDGQWSWDLFYQTLFLSSEIQRIQANYSIAEQLLLQAADSLEANPLSHSKFNGDLSYHTGCVKLDQFELENARGHLINAMRFYRDVNKDNDTLLSPVKNKLGTLKFYSKDYDSALIYFNEAVLNSTNKINKLYDLSIYYLNIGIINSLKGEYDNAEKYFIKSTEIKKSILSPESISMAKTYLNLGKFYQDKSNYQQSLFYISKAEDLYLNLFNRSYIEFWKLYWNKGIVFNNIGDYNKSIVYLMLSFENLKYHYGSEHPLTNSLLMDIGIGYYTTKRYQSAEFYYLKCLEGEDMDLKLKTYRNLAVMYKDIDNNSKAEFFFNKYFELEKQNHRYNPKDKAIGLMHYGDFLCNNRNDSSGLISLNTSKELLLSIYGKKNRDVANIYLIKGNYYFKAAMYSEALQCYQRSIYSFTDQSPSSHFWSNPPIEDLINDTRTIHILFKKAEALSYLYKEHGEVYSLVSSIETFKLFSNLFDQFRISLNSLDSKAQYRKEFGNIYYKSVIACLEAFRITNDSSYLEDAFYFSEKNKSMVLLTEMKEADAWEAGNIAPSIRAYDKELKLEIEASKDFIQKEYRKISPDKVKIARMEAKLFKLELKQDSLVGYLERYHQEYNKLKYELNTARTNDVRKMLRDNEALVMYSMGEGGIIIFLLTRGEFDYYQVPVHHPIAPVISKLNANLHFIDAQHYRYEDYLEYQQLAHELYQVLMVPLQEKIKGKKLIIVPDEELGYLSFDMLLERKDIHDSINFTGLPFLIRQYAISYASSATLFVNNRKRPVESLNKGVLAMAPEYGKVERRGILGLGHFGREENCKSIPWAQKEARDVHRVIGGKILIRDKATKEYFLKLSGNYDIVHLALHTRIDKNYPLSSHLSFYPFEDTVSNGALKVYEILNMDFRGQLAVLSACNTGGGKLEKGEGIISIARAFMFAGIPSVVTTLWDVEDHSSQKLIHGFYKYLEQGMDKDEALRLSKLDYLGETETPIETHPAFWAGYVLYGESSGIDLNPGKQQLAGLSSIFIPSLILAISLYCLIRLRKKRVTLS